MSKSHSTPKARTTISQRLWIFSGTLLAFLLTLGGISYWNTQSLSAAVSELGETYMPAVRSMTLADMMHDGIRAVVYRADYIVDSGTEEEKTEVKNEIREYAVNIKKHLSDLEKLALDSESKEGIKKATPSAISYAESGVELVDLIFAGKKSEAEKSFDTFNERFSVLETELGALGDHIEAASAEVATKDLAKAKSLSNVSVAALVISLFFGVGISFYIVRDLSAILKTVMQSLSTSASKVTHTSEGLERSSSSLSSATEQQAAAIQETAATLEEITSMVRKTSENSKTLEKSSRESLTSAGQGKDAVQNMLHSMSEIRSANTNIMNEINNSNARITEISKVIAEIGAKTKVINEIVFQTKLLSFNASVEAARAGEHGKGFAVVAEEVGNLAVMSGNASKEISDMLDSSLTHVHRIVEENKSRVSALIDDGARRVEQGVQTAQTCGNALEDIHHQSEEVSRMVSEITSAINEQTNGISEISKAINMIDQATQDTSTIATSTAQASSELLSQSSDLGEAVQDLSSLIGVQNEKFGHTSQQTPQGGDSSTPRKFASFKSSKKAA